MKTTTRQALIQNIPGFASLLENASDEEVEVLLGVLDFIESLEVKEGEELGDKEPEESATNVA